MSAVMSACALAVTGSAATRTAEASRSPVISAVTELVMVVEPAETTAVGTTSSVVYAEHAAASVC